MSCQIKRRLARVMLSQRHNGPQFTGDAATLRLPSALLPRPPINKSVSESFMPSHGGTAFAPDPDGTFFQWRACACVLQRLLLGLHRRIVRSGTLHSAPAPDQTSFHPPDAFSRLHMEVTGPAVLLRSRLAVQCQLASFVPRSHCVATGRRGKQNQDFVDSALQEKLGCAGRVVDGLPTWGRLPSEPVTAQLYSFADNQRCSSMSSSLLSN
ncbi:hypothetical protein B0T10DRAFT_310206 [Thelonectria olida]|uniref:Uncharacterized protein n=1 Tax=Thelonectria olida TaxID=1576542 RepID=A0A9P9AR35_9HYPO|nr:hypothetical protein B0T10DRAFT_310206 [Thelonectria olida]